MREFGDVGPDGTPLTGVVARWRFDYEVVNEILAATIDSVQDVLARRTFFLLWVVDEAALRLDEYFAEMVLRFARFQGWNSAVALAVARNPREQQLIRQHLGQVALKLARRIDLLAHLPDLPLMRRFTRLVRRPFVPPTAARLPAGILPLEGERR